MVSVLKQYVEMVDAGGTGDSILKKIELAGRNCYKSEEKISPESSVAFVDKILRINHQSVLEHHNMTMRFVTDRGVLAEITRHRLASFSVESTRYVNYSKKGMVFVLPVEYYDFENFIRTGKSTKNEPPHLFQWLNSIARAEQSYNEMIKEGASPQLSRSVLPNSLKTDIVMTMNLRNWLHMLGLRCAPSAHPQFQELAKQALVLCHKHVPVIFDSLHGALLPA